MSGSIKARPKCDEKFSRNAIKWVRSKSRRQVALPAVAARMAGRRKDLPKKALGGFLRLIIVLATSLFLPAWTVDYWQAWVFLAVFSMSVLAITIYLMKKDPNLLERRVCDSSRG